MSLQQNKANLRRAAEAFNDPDERSSWFELHDSSVEAFGLGPEPLDLDELRHFYQGLWRAFPDLHIEIEDLIGEGDMLAWRLRVAGTHEAEFRGVPPTGTKVEFSAHYFFRFRDGKIAERWTNFDRLGVLVQLGAIPSPV